MNESFFDLGSHNSQLNTEKLLPYFHRFSREGFSGEVTSPVFAGSTSVAEFEFLTGHRANFLPETLQPYVYFIKDNTFSLPRLLNQKNYHSVAYHPFHADYWNREVVYPYLDFKDFVATTQPYQPEFLSATEKYLPFHDDELTTAFTADPISVRKVVADLIAEKSASDSATPQFKFLITIQNHGPYNSNNLFSQQRGDSVAPLLTPFNFTDEEKFYLSNYLLNLADTDRSLELLYRYLNSADAEPTLVLFFGDHQPGLVNNAEIYAEIGLNGDDGQPFSLHETQFFIWSNYFDAQRVGQSLAKNLVDEIYTYDLAPLMYQFLAWPLPDYWRLSRSPQLRRGEQNLPWQSAQYNILFEQSSAFDAAGNFKLF